VSIQDNPGAQFRLDGRVSVVTGGGSGIGRAIALRFAAAGSAVRILDLNFADAEATARLIGQNGGHASACACDVTDLSNVQKVFAAIFAKERVQILVERSLPLRQQRNGNMNLHIARLTDSHDPTGALIFHGRVPPP